MGFKEPLGKRHSELNRYQRKRATHSKTEDNSRGGAYYGKKRKNRKTGLTREGGNTH